MLLKTESFDKIWQEFKMAWAQMLSASFEEKVASNFDK